MILNEILEELTEDKDVERVTSFVISPLIHEIWEERPSFSKSCEMMENAFERLEIDDYNDTEDEQEQFMQKNKWVCEVELQFAEDGYGVGIEVYASSLEQLAKLISFEFKKLKNRNK